MTGNNLLGYRNLLAAIPVQPGEHPVLGRAVKIARRTQGAITLVHVMDRAGDEARETASRHLRQLMSAQPLVKATKVVLGRTWSAINRVADEVKTDLIVLGSYFHGQLRALLGETSDRVLHHTDRDVLVVRRERYDERTPPREFKRVIAAIDLHGDGEAVAEQAGWLAKTCGADLTLLNVMAHFPVDRENEDITPENRDPLAYQRSKRAERLAQLAETVAYLEANREVIVTNGTAGRAVPEYAEECGADLIIIGAHKKYGVGALVGATADTIVHRAPCDVLVVNAGSPGSHRPRSSR